MNKVTIQKTILLFIIICACTCVGCHVQQSEAGEEETDHAGIVQDAMTEPEEKSSENPARRDPKNAKLLCLQSGDMETLLGISFGDRIDYTRFECCASGRFGPLYCEIDAREGSRAYFFFQGKGHGFGGFEVTNMNLGFLGLDQGEDTLERLIDFFGEPDQIDVNEKHDSIAMATWNYEMASLNVVIRNGYISGVEYLAAEGVADGVEIPWEQTELGKDSQGNYDYLESIYQWEATCGSDANDTEASYHPYGDDYDAGRGVLCRSQKFWFDEKQAEFDESGRFVRYHGICETDENDDGNLSHGGMTIYDGYFSL